MSFTGPGLKRWNSNLNIGFADFVIYFLTLISSYLWYIFMIFFILVKFYDCIIYSEAVRIRIF